MTTLVRGKDLTPAQVQEVKRAFVYRLTTENGYPQRNPCKATVPAVSDKEWIEAHAFHITKAGKLSNGRGHNFAEPVWMVKD